MPVKSEVGFADKKSRKAKLGDLVAHETRELHILVNFASESSHIFGGVVVASRRSHQPVGYHCNDWLMEQFNLCPTGTSITLTQE